MTSESDGRGSSPRGALAAAIVAAIVTLVATLAVPAQAPGGDAVPGRLGALTLSCRGTDDLRSIAWLQTPEAVSARYNVTTAPNGAVVSPYGPGPSWLGWPTMRSLKPGQLVGHRALHRRARYASAAALATATFFFTLGIAAWTGVAFAVLGGSSAALGFAGACTLGQGLFQQTTALPVVGAFAAVLGWQSRRPSLVWLAPTLTLLGFYLRPPDALLWAALGLATLVGGTHTLRNAGPRPWVASALLAILCVLPFVDWYAHNTTGILPIGQRTTARTGGMPLWTFSAGTIAARTAALLFSPMRGLLWYAPATVVGLVLAVRARGVAWVLAAGITSQILMYGAWVVWWSGTGYGPRLLGLSAWMAVYLAWSVRGSGSVARWLVPVTTAITLAVGLLGLARYDARRWELRHAQGEPTHAEVWGVADSPLAALFTVAVPANEELLDMPAGPYVYCTHDTLRPLPAAGR